MSTILFRCDGSDVIGQGHVQRCLSLALALRATEHIALFAMRRNAAASAAVTALGFDIVDLQRPAPPCNAPLETWDCTATVAAVHEHGAEHVIVDHYGAHEIYFESLAQTGAQLGVIDDLGDRDLSAADWILNPNPAADNLPYQIRSECRRLVGPQYALLRPSFAQARTRRQARPGDQRQVLITLGGGAHTALVAQILETLNQNSEPLRIRCILPGDQDPFGTIGALAANSPHSVQLLGRVDDLAEHMLWADLAISGAGATAWELCCLGVPMVLLALAPNQQLNATALARAGCAYDAGDPRNGRTLLHLGECVAELLDNPGGRGAFSTAGMRLVDGRGAQRAAAAILAGQPATIAP